MKKTHLVGFALLAIFAFSSFIVASASAEEVPQWLVNGEPIRLGESMDVNILPVEGEENILLEDMNAPGTPDILCEMSNALAWLLPNGEDLQETGECIKTVDDKGTCEAAASITVKLVNLPWTTQLKETEAGVFEDGVTAGTGGNPGWEVKCRILFINVTDICTSTSEKGTVTNLADGLVLIVDDTFVGDECTLNNTTSGLIEEHVILHGLDKLGNLVTLSASLFTKQS
jgi:hypothetical protein